MAKAIIHGHKRRSDKPSKEYTAWGHMRQRCLNKNNAWYKDYGGRGITVCERWMKFENFLADMGKAPSPTHSLDRINNDGNYEIINCKWSTKTEQSRNNRTTWLVEYNGATVPLIELTSELGLKIQTVKWRLKQGWSLEVSLRRELHKRNGTMTK